MTPQSHTIILCGLIILAANAGVLIAMRRIRNARHGVKADYEVFRYSPIVAMSYMIGPPLVGSLAYLAAVGPTLSPPKTSMPIIATSIVSVSLLTLVGVWYKSFSLAVGPYSLQVRSIFGERTAQFTDIGKDLSDRKW
jgi:hypothetical protein